MGGAAVLQACLGAEKSSASPIQSVPRAPAVLPTGNGSSLQRGVPSLGKERIVAPGDALVCGSPARLDETEINMKPMKSAIACLAAAGILLSQPAFAAGAARSGSSANGSEQLAGTPGAALPAIIAILAVAVVAVVAASGNHKDHHPTSP